MTKMLRTRQDEVCVSVSYETITCIPISSIANYQHTDGNQLTIVVIAML